MLKFYNSVVSNEKKQRQTMLMSVIWGKEERPKGAAVEGTGVGRKQNESEESKK